ncbi:hypothetical protein J2Z60_001542 [Lactobacillus colini]|uniref:ABC transporter permease n=1 Tax=Lactobacillus colini TaxID=1819254 RepID=A0ABS4MFG6_9LACO|nr:hypothetical protein [Lactobacillus colini]MBP2058363.1 hypothetical protein [Lactobacillus colini]
MALVKRTIIYYKNTLIAIELGALILLALIVLVSGKNSELAQRYLIVDVTSSNVLFPVIGLFGNFVISNFHYQNDYFSLIRISPDNLFKDYIYWIIDSVIATSLLITISYQLCLWLLWGSIFFYPLVFIWAWLTSSSLVLAIELIIILFSIIFSKLNVLYLGSFIFISLGVYATTANGSQLMTKLTGINNIMTNQDNLTIFYFLIAWGIITLLVLLMQYLFKMRETR